MLHNVGSTVSDALRLLLATSLPYSSSWCRLLSRDNRTINNAKSQISESFEHVAAALQPLFLFLYVSFLPRR